MSTPTFGDYIQIIAAGITFLAVLVALFANRFWRWIDRPKIDVYFNEKNSEYYHSTIQTDDCTSLPAYYIRLKVTNKGSRTLENAEVVLEKVEPIPDKFISLNLSWAVQVPDITGIARTVRIPQGQSRIVDIVEVTEPSQTLQISNSKSGIEKERLIECSKGFRCCSIKPHTLSDILPAGKYTFYIGVYADNVKQKFIKLSIKYDGSWGTQGLNGMRNKHLKVSLLLKQTGKNVFLGIIFVV